MVLPERSSPRGVQRDLRLPPPAAGVARPRGLAGRAVALSRTSEGRVVGGVCQGLGRFLDVDPWLLRGVFVLLAVAQGTGGLFYLVLWLVVPVEQITSPPQSGRATSRVGRGLLLGAAVLFALDVSLGLPASRTAVQSLWPLFLVALGIASLADHRRSSSEPGSPVLARRARWVQAAALVVFGSVWLADTAGVVSMPWPVVLPVTLAAAGIAAFLATEHERWTGLVRVGLVTGLSLSLVALTGLPYEGGFGERLIRPPQFGALAAQHQLAVGVLTLDLRHLRPSSLPLNVTAGVGVGWLMVRLPAGVAAQVDGRVASGELQLGRRSQAGYGLQEQMMFPGPGGAPRLILHLSAGVGAIIVPSPSP